MSDEIITIPYDSNEFIELGWIYEKIKLWDHLLKNILINLKIS